MIADDGRWIFVHIQKTGGSSIRAALGGPLHDPHKHRTALELRGIYGDEAWRRAFRFAFVRNPWERLVSWWAMIEREGRRDPSACRHNPFWTYVLERAATFEEFLYRCGDEIADGDGRKWIYRNQVDYLVDEQGTWLIDYVGRFEHLRQDLERLTARLGVAMPELSHLNASRHKPYRDYYTPAAAQFVARRFTKDIDAFGYSFDAGPPAPVLPTGTADGAA